MISRQKKIISTYLTPKLKKTLTISTLIGLNVVAIILFLVVVISSKSLFDTVSADMANSFLATIAQVTAGTIAIVFTVSTLAITIVSDRYGIRLMKEAIYSPLTILTFLFLLFCSSISAISIGISYPMYQWSFLLLVFFFTFCISLLLFYIQETLSFIMPEGMAKHLENEAKYELENKALQIWETRVTALGDIALKAFNRDENEIVKIYLNSLNNLQQHWAICAEPIKHDTVLIQSLANLHRQHPIFVEYERVLKVFLGKSDDDLSREVRSLAFQGIIALANQDDKLDLLRGLLAKYQAMLAIAIKENNPVKYGFLYHYRDFIWQRRKDGSEIPPEYLALFFGSFIAANHIIIEKGDVELLRSTISFFCTGYPSVYELVDKFNNLLFDLDGVVKYQHTEWLDRWRYQTSQIVTPYINDATYRMLNYLSNELKEQFPKLEDTIIFHSLTNGIRGIYITKKLVEVFFFIGFYAFKSHKFDYLDQIWSTDDAFQSFVRFPSTLGFNILLIYNYTINNHYLSDFEDELFMKQYCFLYLAYTLRKDNKSSWMPRVPFFSQDQLEKNDDFTKALKEEIEAVYNYLIFLPSYLQSKLSPLYEDLISSNKDFTPLLGGNAQQCLLAAYEWLQNPDWVESWKKEGDEIVKNLQLDLDKVQDIKQQIAYNYQTLSKLNLIVNITNKDFSENDAKPLGHLEHVNKIDMTFLGDINEIEVGFIANSVVVEEEDHIVNTLLQNLQIEHFSSVALTFSLIETTVLNIQKLGTIPTIMFVAPKVLSKAFDQDVDFRAKVRSSGGKGRHLVVADGIDLLILEILGNAPPNAIIFSPEIGIWRESPITITIENCPKDPMKLHTKTQKNFEYEVVNPAFGIILDFTTESQS